MTGDVDEAPGGRLAGLLCRLANERFTGVVYAEHDQAGGVFSFRDGRVVFAEDLGDAQSIGDGLLEKGLLTQAQYAEVATLVIESLAENEEIAFCEHAVRLGFLSQQQADAEIVRLVRGLVIQAVGWEGCRVEVDADPDALTGIVEHPQDVGPLVHIGVRTFFDEDRIRATIGREGEAYARLTRPEHEIAPLLGLDESETALVSRIRPDVPLARVIDESGVDSFEAWQVVCTLALAGAAELGNSPFSSAERSGVRNTQAITPATGKYSSPNDVREEHVRQPSHGRMPAARAVPLSQARIPVAREDNIRAGSQARIPVAREDNTRAGSQARIPVAREDNTRAGSQARIPVAREDNTRAGSQARIPVAREDDARQPVVERRPTPQRPPARSVPAEPAPASPARPSQPGAQGAAAAPPRERSRPRKLSSALKRLDRDLKQFRPPTAPSAPAPGPTPSAAPASYARARVEQLRRMRGAAQNHAVHTPKAEVSKNKGADAFRAAQEAMREQQFGRAHELMRKACEGDPDNETYSMYSMWAAFRANALRQEELIKLRSLLRDKVSDDLHKGFAYYALGHIALAEKKDDAAEKFFMKAAELDKTNKDAERHVRIIAVRRKSAEQERANKIFGIEIGPKKS